MKVYGGVDVNTHIFLTLVLVGVSDEMHAPANLPPGREPPPPVFIR
jgi:hypothetical protein